MAGGKISEAQVFGLTIRESATDGSDFTNPAADYRRFFLGEDGSLHLKDSAGTVTDIGPASGIPATIFDAQGDIIVASAADTAARLAKGADGAYLKAGAATLVYALPPGHEYNYTEFTSPVTISATSEATANTIVAASAGIAFDGSTPILVQLFAPFLTGSSTNGDNCILTIYDDTGGGAASIGKPGQWTNPAGAASERWGSVSSWYRFTPSAATHTLSWRAYRVTANFVFGAGAGGIGNSMPGFIRITKAT